MNCWGKKRISLHKARITDWQALSLFCLAWIWFSFIFPLFLPPSFAFTMPPLVTSSCLFLLLLCSIFSPTCLQKPQSFWRYQRSRFWGHQIDTWASYADLPQQNEFSKSVKNQKLSNEKAQKSDILAKMVCRKLQQMQTLRSIYSSSSLLVFCSINPATKIFLTIQLAF